ncbi:MAG: peptidylprolyl isomerase [Candidatus Woesearchaeota archaeon]
MKVDKNTKVKAQYELWVDEQMIDSSDDAELFVGFNMLIPGFETRILGLQENEETEFDVPPEEGFGQYKLELIQSVPLNQFSEKERAMLVKGKVLQLYARGVPLIAVVKDVTPTDVVFDFNHPLAGKTLHYKVKIISIEPITKEEVDEILNQKFHYHSHPEHRHGEDVEDEEMHDDSDVDDFNEDDDFVEEE